MTLSAFVHLHADAGETLLLRLPVQAGHGLQLGDVRQRGRQRLCGRHRHLPRHALAGCLEHGAPGLLGAAGRSHKAALRSSIPGLVQQSAGTLDLYSMQIRASAFEGESVSACSRHPGRPRSCRTVGRRRCRPLTCTPRSWRPCRAGSGRRRGALGPGSSCRCARCSTGSPPGSGCSHPRSLPRCAWPGPRCSRCWGEPSSLTARRPWAPGSALLWRPPPRRPLRRPESALLFAAPRPPP